MFRLALGHPLVTILINWEFRGLGEIDQHHLGNCNHPSNSSCDTDKLRISSLGRKLIIIVLVIVTIQANTSLIACGSLTCPSNQELNFDRMDHLISNLGTEDWSILKSSQLLQRLNYMPTSFLRPINLPKQVSTLLLQPIKNPFKV